MKKSSSIILLIILLANSIHAMDNSARNAISNYKAILETEVDKSFGPIVDFSKYQIQTNLVIERKFVTIHNKKITKNLHYPLFKEIQM